MNDDIPSPLVGAPEPRSGPIASGRTWVNKDLTFPKNFVEYAVNVLNHKTESARLEAARDTITNLMSGNRAGADDRLQVYPICLEMLPTWKPGDRAAKAKVHAKSEPAGFYNTLRWSPEQRAHFVLESAWRSFKLTVTQAHEAFYFLVPLSAIEEALGASEAAHIKEQRELLLTDPYGATLAEVDRYLSDQEAWDHVQWQRANKKGPYG